MIRKSWIWVVLLASLRLAHINLLWADEDYHLAAAIRLLNGQLPYRDFWYDKPPVAAFFYSIIGGLPGWPLRLLDMAFVLACCWVAYKLAKALWGEREGHAAALLLAFFTTFYLTSATVPFAVDGLLLLPHMAAIYFAFQRRPFLCGVCCALGLLTNVKAICIVATCALWLLPDLPLLAAGLALPLALVAVPGALLGLFGGFYQQVWQWGLVYVAANNTLGDAIRHSADWLAFHAALLAGVIVARHELRYPFGAWFLLSCAPLVLGNHFAPRYFFQLLPVMVIVASRGIVIGFERHEKAASTVLALMLIIPVARFGPRYAELIWDNSIQKQTIWSDAALDVDSQNVANIINAHKHGGDTLFVWGYRPDVYVYTRLTPDGKFSDSQPLDGVPADRHLQSSNPSPGIPAITNRMEFMKTRPTYFVDGLGILNQNLSPNRFADLTTWLNQYRLLATTKLSRIYVLNVPVAAVPSIPSSPNTRHP